MKTKPDIEKKQIFSGITASILTCASSVVIIEAAINARFATEEIISWLSAVYIMGGLISILLSYRYKIPILGAHSLASVIYLTPIISGYSYNTLIGAYFLAGLIIVLVGLFGVFDKWISKIPSYVVEAMLAGIVVNYIFSTLPALSNYYIIVSLTILCYILTMIFSRKIPPFFGGLLVILIAILLAGPYEFAFTGYIATFNVGTPELNINNLLTLAIPLAILILSNESAISLSVLRKNGFKPPARPVIISSGIGTAFVSFFGGHAASVGGMSTTICSGSESGQFNKRYYAAITGGIVIIAFGFMSPIMLSIITQIPPPLISLLVLTTLIGILIQSFKGVLAQTSKYNYFVAFLTFAITMLNLSIYAISAPLLSLIIGIGLHSIKKSL